LAIRFYPDMATKHAQLKDAGKPAKAARTAILRKLLIPANIRVKDDREWREQAA
jgi:transposase